MRHIVFACCVLVLMYPVVGLAQESDDVIDYAQTGWYFLLSAGTAYPAFNNDETIDEFHREIRSLVFPTPVGITTDIEDKTSFVWGGRVGYRATQQWALEVEVLRIQDFKSDLETRISSIDETVFLNADASTEGTAIMMNGKGYLGSLGRVQPYVVGGIGRAFFTTTGSASITGIGSTTLDESEDDGFTAKGGVGVDIYFNQHVAMNIEASYYRTFGDIEDADFIPVTAGILYRW